MRCARSYRLRITLSLLIALTAAAPADAQVDPTYIYRLELPIPGDSIGHSGSVTADLHAGEIFVCDTRNSRILIFDGDGIYNYQINGGRTFSGPRDLAIDPEGFLLIVAHHKRRQAVIELDFDGAFVREIELSGLPEVSSPPLFASLALSPSGDRIFLLDSINLMLWIVNRDGELLASTDLAEGLSEKERFDVILNHVDVYGDRVLVPFSMAGVIRLFDLDGRRVGQVGVKGGSPCTLGFPTAAALDSVGNLVIIDQQRMVIMRWSPEDNRCLGEYYGIGSSLGYLYYPHDLALDWEGRLYVSQGFQGRIQVYEGFPKAAGTPEQGPLLLGDR